MAKALCRLLFGAVFWDGEENTAEIYGEMAF